MALDHVAAAKLEATDLRLADVDVVVADVVAGAPQEAVTFRQDVQDAAAHLDAGARYLRLHQKGNQLIFLDLCRRRYFDVEFFGDVDQFALRFLRELSGGKHRRNFDLRKLLVKSGLMLRKMMAPARATAASALLLAHIVGRAMFGLQKSISL